MKKCCVALLLLTASSAVAAEPDAARFIEFTGTMIDGHTARPTTLYVDGRQRIRFERLLSLKKSLREALSASQRDPNLR